MALSLSTAVEEQQSEHQQSTPILRHSKDLHYQHLSSPAHLLTNNNKSASMEQQQQLYSLRWHDFQTSILSSFRHLRDEEDFVDVTLACDGKSFTAHKMVLSACSPYFRHLLKVPPPPHENYNSMKIHPAPRCHVILLAAQ